MLSEGRGRLYILSAPSGTGKTTLARGLVQAVPRLRLSRSYTSRPPRDGERHGVDYEFVTAPQFEAMRGRGEFLEWAEVFGHLYGTGAAETGRVLAQGDDLLLVIDVQGARKVRASGVESVGVFVLPPSFEVLEQRLRGRSREGEEQIRRRLKAAREEVKAFVEYDFVVVNDEIETCVERLKSIVLSERSRLAAMGARASAVSRTFAD